MVSETVDCKKRGDLNAEKPFVRTPMGIQDVKNTKTPFKTVLQYFCQIYWSLLEKMSLRNSVFVVPEILRLFVKILTPDEKYSLSVKASV